MSMNLGTLGSLAIDIGANLARFTSDMGRAARIAEQRSAEIRSSISKGIGAGVVAAAAGAAIATIAVKKAIDRADELDELSQKVGASTASLSRLQFGAQLEGVQDFAGAMVKLNRSIIESKDGNSEAAKAFAALGVKTTDASGKVRASDEVIRDVAKSFAGAEDGAAKSAIAMALFGKAGAELIPFLNNGAEGLDQFNALADRLGITVDQKTAKAAGQFNDKLFIGHRAIEGLSQRVAAGLLPVLNDLVGQWVDYSTNAETAKKITDGISYGVKGLISTALVLKSVLEAVGTLIGTEFGALANIFHNANLNATDAAIPLKGLIKIGIAAKDELPNIKGALVDIGAGVSRDWAQIAKVWEAGNSKIKDAVTDTAATIQKGKNQLKFGGATGPTEADKALDHAGQQLRDMDANLRQQVETFGKGEAAMLSYRLSVGDLSDEVKVLGEQGQILADSIRVQASELEGYKAMADAFAESQRKAQQNAESIIQAGSKPDLQSQADAIRRAGEQGGLGSFGRVMGGIEDAKSGENKRFDEQRERLRQDQENRLLDQQQFNDAMEAAERTHQDNMKSIEESGQEAKRSLYANAFDAIGNLGSEFQSSVLAQSKKGFEISKAISIAQTVMKTYEMATSAYAALAGIPVVGPALGAAAAATAITFGLAQVAAIQSTSFEGRRYGGAVRKGSMYEVAEGGQPELLTIRGKTMLMMGDADGYVSPAKPGSARAPSAMGAGPRVYEIHNEGEPLQLRVEEIGERVVMRMMPLILDAADTDQATRVTTGRGRAARAHAQKFGLQPKSVR